MATALASVALCPAIGHPKLPIASVAKSGAEPHLILSVNYGLAPVNAQKYHGPTSG